MAALDFPDNPATGDLYGSSGTVWRWDGARWASTAGASGARGRVAYAQTTVSQGGFTAPTVFNIAGLSVTYNATAGRTYRIVGKISTQTNVANDLAQLLIATDTGQQINGVNFALPAVNLAYGAVCEHVYTAAATSAQTIKLMYAGYVGGSSHTVYASALSPNFISVEDITYEAGSSGVGIEPTAWTALTLINGWVNFSPGAFEVAQYRKVGDTVQIRGMVKSGAIGTIMFTLPVGFRPITNAQFATVSNALYGYMTMGTNGDVAAAAGSNAWFQINCQFSVTP